MMMTVRKSHVEITTATAITKMIINMMVVMELIERTVRMVRIVRTVKMDVMVVIVVTVITVVTPAGNIILKIMFPWLCEHSKYP
jgi:hypothetical protein